MSTAPGRQDGIAALRQRLFFAGELVRLAERELAGVAINRQGLAMACRNGAVLQLHAVMTGFLDDVATRMRLERAPESLTVPVLLQALSARGLGSPELGRVAGLLETGWLHDCVDDIRRCLSSTPDGSRESDIDQEENDEPEQQQNRVGVSGQRIAMVAVAVVAGSSVELLTAADFARIRFWIAGWKSLLDEFLLTLEEY